MLLHRLKRCKIYFWANIRIKIQTNIRTGWRSYRACGNSKLYWAAHEALYEHDVSTRTSWSTTLHRFSLCSSMSCCMLAPKAAALPHGCLCDCLYFWKDFPRQFIFPHCSWLVFNQYMASLKKFLLPVVAVVVVIVVAVVVFFAGTDMFRDKLSSKNADPNLVGHRYC